MKLFIVFLVIISVSHTYGQSEDETLNWLNSKKIETGFKECGSLGKLDFNTAGIKWVGPLKTGVMEHQLYTYTEDMTISWDEIKSCKIVGTGIFICSMKERYCFRVSGDSDEVLNQYLKALKHMGQLHGAQFTNDELFK